MNIESAICLPFTKVDCSSAIIFGSTRLILLANILRMIFIVVFIRLIGRKSVSSVGLTVFGIKDMKEEFIPVVRMKNDEMKQSPL